MIHKQHLKVSCFDLLNKAIIYLKCMFLMNYDYFISIIFSRDFDIITRHFVMRMNQKPHE